LTQRLSVIKSESWQNWSSIRGRARIEILWRGWWLGSKTFRVEVLAQAKACSDDERIAQLPINSEEQCEFKLK
jgi:hypothetical protein